MGMGVVPAPSKSIFVHKLRLHCILIPNIDPQGMGGGGGGEGLRRKQKN